MRWLGAAAVLATVACGQGDSTEIFAPVSDEGLTGGEGSAIDGSPIEGDEAAELERLRAENEAFIEQARQEAREFEAQLTPEERAELEARVAELAVNEPLRLEQARAAASSPEEEAQVRSTLEEYGLADGKISFQGRTVMVGDVLYLTDELLAAAGEAAAEGLEQAEADPAAAVPKAQLPAVADATKFPTSTSLPKRPMNYASVANGQAFFRRPETNRVYYLVVPDAAPASVFDAVLQASNDIEAALTDDCLGTTVFQPIRSASYNLLEPSLVLFNSRIDVAYGAGASVCADEANGCARFPFTTTMQIDPAFSQIRLSLGTYIGLQTDIPNAPLTTANLRAVVLHELTHILGFVHPSYALLGLTSLSSTLVRVPTTAEGTVPTILAPLGDHRASTAITLEDRQTLRKTYSGACTYTGNPRVMGLTCGSTFDTSCRRHGGACEVDASGGNWCRWPNFTDSTSCVKGSVGTWQATQLRPGETNTCITNTLPSVNSCDARSAVTASSDFTGNCCQQAEGRPGLFFPAFSSAFATTYLCSDMRGGAHYSNEHWKANWEFESTGENNDFVAKTATSAAALNPSPWTLDTTTEAEGVFTQPGNVDANMLISDDFTERMQRGCVETLAIGNDNDESGIVFDYDPATHSYWVFDLVPSTQARIRKFNSGVEATAFTKTFPVNFAANWSAGIKLRVCFGDTLSFNFGTGTFQVIGAPVFTYDANKERYVGIWNHHNQGVRHRYLRSFPFSQGI